MEDAKFRKSVIELKKREELRVAKQCTNIFKNTEELISALKMKEINTNSLEVNEILEGINNKLESLIWKILAVELVAHSSGKLTPGVDGKAFYITAAKATSKERANKILRDEIDKLKTDVSLAKGKSSQVIQRKGINNLNKREKLR